MAHCFIRRFWFACLSGLLLSCSKPGSEPAPVIAFPAVPANFPGMPAFPDNPVTKGGVALGRKLFFDSRLSGNNQISCATCHRPEKAFSDGMVFSNEGITGTPLHRHTPSLMNMAWMNNGLFWDGGSTNLESQAFAPLAAADEMHQNLAELMAELKDVPEYVRLFSQVFPEGITQANVVKALAQFQRSLISAGSRYDKYVRQEAGGVLSAAELRGREIVRQKCQGCHAGELFTDNEYHNNGLDEHFDAGPLEGLYLGRGRITYLPADEGKYKTPTLRNLAFTAPYMHDGRFADLGTVLNHYSEGTRSSATLDVRLKPAPSISGIPLTVSEKDDILAFLQTLSDSTFINSFN